MSRLIIETKLSADIYFKKDLHNKHTEHWQPTQLQKISCQSLLPSGSMGPGNVCNFYLVKNHKISNTLLIALAGEKNNC